MMNNPIVSEPVYALHVIDGARCFAGYAQGLFASDDAGRSWRYAYQSLLGEAPLATMSMVSHAQAQGMPVLFAGARGAVLRSWDGGREWQVSRLPDPEPLVSALALSPHYEADGMIFAATAEDGVFISSDRGERWSVWNFGLLDPNVLCLAISPSFRQDEQVFAGVNSGLFRSHNRGRSWQPVALPGGYNAVLSLALSPAFDQKGTGFLGTEEHGVFRTQDGGGTWEMAENNGLDGPVNGLALGENGWMAALVDTRLMASEDSAKTWQPWPFSTIPEGIEITIFAAPQGVGPGLPLWIGASDGQVLRVS
jgi:photosystem II stability/assembly factor-like uncharacterized protein